MKHFKNMTLIICPSCLEEFEDLDPENIEDIDGILEDGECLYCAGHLDND